MQNWFVCFFVGCNVTAEIDHDFIRLLLFMMWTIVCSHFATTSNLYCVFCLIKLIIFCMKWKKTWFPCLCLYLNFVASSVITYWMREQKTSYLPTKWISFRDHCFARTLCLCFYLNYKLNLNVIVCVLGCCLLSVLHIQMLPLTMFLWPGSSARFNVNSHDSEISAEIV